MSRPVGLVVMLWLLAVCPAVLRADEAPYARAYLDRINAGLDQIGSQMSTVTEAADLAAEAIVAGHGFGVRGDTGLANELSNRAGALMGYDGRRGVPGDVILYVFHTTGADDPGVERILSNQINEAARLKVAGSVVIGIGIATDAVRQACSIFIENGATHTDLPSDTVLNTAAAWTFECELFSALTRRDKVPVIYQSFEIDTLHHRWVRYSSQKFHDDRRLDPIAPGTLGHAYLNDLHEVLLDIGTASWRRIARTATRAELTLVDGGKVWLRPGGRYLPYHLTGPFAIDPGLFTLLTHDGSNPKRPSPGKDDFVIAVGDCETAGSWEWGKPELLRQAGRGVAWIVNGYNTQPRDLHRREILIDLWGQVGDAAVKVKDYDTRLGPTSSVAAEAVTWMIASEVAGRIHERNASHS